MIPAPSLVARASSYYSCAVDRVVQTYSNTCWAASTACIVNKINGSSLNDVAVAKNYKGSSSASVFNTGIQPSEAVRVFQLYGLPMHYANYLSDSAVKNNLTGGYPIYSSWESGTIGHAMVIYGKIISTGTISIMDPASGFCSGSSYLGSQYIMTNPSSGRTFTSRGFTSRLTS